MNSSTTIKSVLVGMMVAGGLGVAASAVAGGGHMDAPKMVKCYGVNAAYKNDCQSPGHSCAGQDARARDPQAFVAVPTGLCQKLAGGSTHPGSMMMKKKG